MRTASVLKKNKTDRINVPYGSAQKIGILFTAEDKAKYDSVKDFKQSFEDEGKKVEVLSFLGKGKENYEFRFDIFSAKDVSFWGKYTSEAVIKFADTEFDYLYCVDTEPNIFNEHIIAMSKAKCRIGIYLEERSDYYELMINLTNGALVKDLIKEMQFYTKQFRTS